MKALSHEQVSRIAERARAIGDETRVRILDALDDEEHSVGELAALLRVEPSMISKHLQVLFHARLVTRRRQASSVIYAVVATQIVTICRYLAGADLLAAKGRRGTSVQS